MDIGVSRLMIWLPLAPLAGCVLIGLALRRRLRAAGAVAAALVMAILILVLFSGTLVLPWSTQPSRPEITWSDTWISDLSFHVNLTLDGLSGWMILMTCLTAISCLLFAGLVEPHGSARRIIALLILTSGAIGVFLAQDILSFLFAWGIWLILPFFADARHPERQHAIGTVKFFIFHLLSFLMIAGGLSMVHFGHFQSAGIQSLSMAAISRISLPAATQHWAMILMMLGIAIRLPLFPFHSWLSDTMDEFPASISGLIASTGLATGIITVLRIVIPLCPDACLDTSKYIVFAALLSMVYGALVALMNPHLLQRLGFICLSYSGLLLLGLFTLNGTGFLGATLATANFIPVSASLILIMGWICSRANSDLIQDFGSVWNKYPLLTVSFLLLSLALIGLPGLNLFPGIFLVIGGIIQAQPVWAALALIAFLILGTGILWLFQKVFTGKPSPTVDSFRSSEDMIPGRILIPITALIIWFGFFPQYTIRSLNDPTDTVNRYVQSLRIYKKTSPGMTPMEHFFRQHMPRKN